MSVPEPMPERLIALESLVTHLQADVEALNEAVLEQRGELERLRAMIGDLGDRLDRALLDGDSGQTGEEKPPHY